MGEAKKHEGEDQHARWARLLHQVDEVQSLQTGLMATVRKMDDPDVEKVFSETVVKQNILFARATDEFEKILKRGNAEKKLEDGKETKVGGSVVTPVKEIYHYYLQVEAAEAQDEKPLPIKPEKAGPSKKLTKKEKSVKVEDTKKEDSVQVGIVTKAEPSEEMKLKYPWGQGTKPSVSQRAISSYFPTVSTTRATLYGKFII